MLLEPMIAVLAAVGTLSAASATAPAGADMGWRNYVNVRFGYRICYPAALMRAQPEADNGDGRRFVAADGGTLAVFGRNNIDEPSLGKTVDEDAADRSGKRGKISYRVVRPTWAVVSGDDGAGTVFYSKTIKRADQFMIFDLAYPKSREARYKGVAERLSRCFAALS